MVRSRGSAFQTATLRPPSWRSWLASRPRSRTAGSPPSRTSSSARGRAAYHEADHAVAAYWLGRRVEGIDIDPATLGGGAHVSPSDDWLREVVTALAGAAASGRFEPHGKGAPTEAPGQTRDVVQASIVASCLVLRAGLPPVAWSGAPAPQRPSGFPVETSRRTLALVPGPAEEPLKPGQEQFTPSSSISGAAGGLSCQDISRHRQRVAIGVVSLPARKSARAASSPPASRMRMPVRCPTSATSRLAGT